MKTSQVAGKIASSILLCKKKKMMKVVLLDQEQSLGRRNRTQVLMGCVGVISDVGANGFGQSRTETFYCVYFYSRLIFGQCEHIYSH